MLKLIVFPPAMGLISPSPFSMKAIALMQMSGLEYEFVPGDPRKAPKNKLPVLIEGIRTIPDSSHIQLYLEQDKQVDFDGELNAEQKAVALAFRALCEDHLYWVGVYDRWIMNADHVREEFFGDIPAPMRKIVFNKVQKDIRRNLYGQGMGRHSSDEIYAFGAADIQAITGYLEDKPFFFGDRPTSVDAIIFAFLINNLVPRTTSYPPQCQVGSYPSLVAYCERFVERFDIPQV